MKPVLDACCGSRMFWFDAKDPRALFVDCRKMKTEAIWKSGNGRATRYCTVDPDLVADFRALPFPNESFWHVVFDPPHLLHVGDNAWMAKKYGKLPGDWRPLIHDGFHECMRVLRQFGTLIFKWNEYNIPVRDVIDAIGVQPMYGHKSGKQSKTHWMAFLKIGNYGNIHCNGGDCEHAKLGAEPCTDCQYCDAEGNL